MVRVGAGVQREVSTCVAQVHRCTVFKERLRGRFLRRRRGSVVLSSPVGGSLRFSTLLFPSSVSSSHGCIAFLDWWAAVLLVRWRFRVLLLPSPPLLTELPFFSACSRRGSLCCRLGDWSNMLSAYGLALRLGLSCKVGPRRVAIVFSRIPRVYVLCSEDACPRLEVFL